MIKIGNTVVEESVNKESFIEIIEGLHLKPPVIIKPNWGFSVCFTEAEILDWTLEACYGDALVVESYGWARSKDMLVKGEWGSFERADLRKSDEWFMDYSGIGKVLEKHYVEFLNITEEYWAKRTASPASTTAHAVRRTPTICWTGSRVRRVRGAPWVTRTTLWVTG
jgi:hypothetical protein